MYFAGDTDLFEAMADLAGADVALVPIGGWGPSVGERAPRRPHRGRRHPPARRRASSSPSTGARTARSRSAVAAPTGSAARRRRSPPTSAAPGLDDRLHLLEPGGPLLVPAARPPPGTPAGDASPPVRHGRRAPAADRPRQSVVGGPVTTCGWPSACGCSLDPAGVHIDRRGRAARRAAHRPVQRGRVAGAVVDPRPDLGADARPRGDRRRRPRGGVAARQPPGVDDQPLRRPPSSSSSGWSSCRRSSTPLLAIDDDAMFDHEARPARRRRGGAT